MISLKNLLAILPAADSGVWAIVVAAAGAMAGRLLTRWVGGLLDSGVFAEGQPAATSLSPEAGRRRWIEVGVAAAAVGLWWWEVPTRGLGPATSLGLETFLLPPLDGALVSRWAAHAVLGLLLAAAAWIDIRYRVIPDCVTLPGVLLGLVVVWLLPDVLLPVGCEVPRSFAPPIMEADVLGWFGGLRTQSPPPWMGAAPHGAGLLVPAVIWLAWWAICTAPFLVPVDLSPSGTPRTTGWRRIEPRNLILPAGLVAIAAAWLVGGDRFWALQSSLIGLGVSAGLVWSIREGASRALGREAMGLGDVTLMAMVGAWIGWQASILAFFMAAFIGLAHGLLQVMWHRENELPYGPSLCLASAVVIVSWHPLWERVSGPFSQPLELAVVIGIVVVLTAATLFVWQRLRR